MAAISYSLTRRESKALSRISPCRWVEYWLAPAGRGRMSSVTRSLMPRSARLLTNARPTSPPAPVIRVTFLRMDASENWLRNFNHLVTLWTDGDQADRYTAQLLDAQDVGARFTGQVFPATDIAQVLFPTRQL